jgi:hypothetical protein
MNRVFIGFFILIQLLFSSSINLMAGEYRYSPDTSGMSCPNCPLNPRPPYGGFCPKKGVYGEKRPVKSPEEALRLVREYFSSVAKVNEVEGLEFIFLKERKWFFVIEVRRKNELLDILILDRRTGRIRSIY